MPAPILALRSGLYREMLCVWQMGSKYTSPPVPTSGSASSSKNVPADDGAAKGGIDMIAELRLVVFQYRIPLFARKIQSVDIEIPVRAAARSLRMSDEQRKPGGAARRHGVIRASGDVFERRPLGNRQIGHRRRCGDAHAVALKFRRLSVQRGALVRLFVVQCIELIPCSCRTLAPPPSSPFVSLLYTKQKNGADCSVFCLVRTKGLAPLAARPGTQPTGLCGLHSCLSFYCSVMQTARSRSRLHPQVPS